ncbi:MAG: PVC-type heme-binding CxxCH protein, partial [Verrucomicrobium sp.]
VYIEELPPTPGAPTWEKLGGVNGQRAKLKPADAAKPAAVPAAGLLAPSTASIKPLGKDGQPLNLGFETRTLQDWTAEGSAWEGQPVKGDTVILRKRGQSNHTGEYWMGGYEKVGDKGIGRLTSASFKVTQPWASFLVGAGKDAKVVRVEIVDASSGDVLHSASGIEQENMRREIVDLRTHAGRDIFVRLVDEDTRGWGHLNFDDFVFHDKEPVLTAPPKPPATGLAARQKESPVLRHLVANPAKATAVKSASAQKLVTGMMVTPGFQAQLIAAEPEVRQPIAFAFDERGRLWVAEAYSYPTRQPEGQGKDRIVILEDETGDGTFQKRTVFVEGLNLVSGLEVGFGGVWVGAAPELIFIPRDAQDRPGKAQVLLDGWGFQDTHETLNSFSWGPDGWLYGNQGVFTHSRIGRPGTPEAQRIELRSGVWRYHPIRHQFEIFASGGSNQWGLDFNENGHLFMTHCRSFWGGGGTTHVIRNGHFWNQANSGYAPFISSSGPDFAPDLRNYLPASAKYDSGEGGAGKPGSTAIYGGHSHVGTLIYLGDNWPDAYRNHLFTHNLHGHQMNHQVNERQRSGYETKHAGFDLIFSPDPTYMAVDLQTGPDGAVYVIDWSDTQECHNPAEEKWDRSNGRVYRISWAENYRPAKVDLGTKSDLELAQLHTHRNDWYSRMARNLLQDRAGRQSIDSKAVDLLKQQAGGEEVPRVLRALWTLHVIGALDRAQLEGFARHSSDVVRSWAVQLATERAGENLLSGESLMKLAQTDPSPTVRLAVASALPTLPPAQIWPLAEALAGHGEDREDRFLPRMIWFGLGPVVHDDWDRALRLAETSPLPSLGNSIRWQMSRDAAGREAFVASLAAKPDEVASMNLRLLAFGLKDEASAPMPKAWPQVQARLAQTGGTVDQLAALFGDKAVLARMRDLLADGSQPQAKRQMAFDVLKRSNDPLATPIFAGLLDADAFRSAVIPLLARSSDPATAEALLKRFEKLEVTDRGAALGVLTSRPQLALPLLEAAQRKEFKREYLTALQVRQMRSLKDARVDQLLDASWGKVNESSEAAKGSILRLKKAYSAAPLWAYNPGAGRQTFNQLCAVCHAYDGAGGKLGPDLGGSWRNGIDYFLENIIDPNAVVGDNFQLHVVTKKDGAVLSGVQEQESATSMTLRTITEAVVIPKAEVASQQKMPQSLMPPGLLEALPERQAIELLKFLTSKP